MELSRQNEGLVRLKGELHISLRALFQMDGEVPEVEKIVIVEHEEQRVGFMVDRVLGTHQTVLQPMGGSSATSRLPPEHIMGDGGVALILDIASIVKLANQQAREGSPALTLRTA